jgi:hypothetical protein
MNVFHDKVRYLEFGDEVVINLNLGNAWRTVVADCLIVDILQSLVLSTERHGSYI